MAGLPKQNVSISFSKGVDTKTDSKQVIAGKMLVLENATFQSVNRIDKRNGYKLLPNAGTQGSAIASYKDELLVFDGLNVSSYSPALTTFTNKGQAVSTELKSRFVIANGATQTLMDVAYNSNGFKTYTWIDSRGGARYSVLDSTTNELLVNDAVVSASALQIKVISIGNKFVFLYYNGTNLVQKSFSIAAPSVLTSEVNLITTVTGANRYFDAVLCGSRIFFTWNDSSGACGVAYLDSNLSLSAPYLYVGENPTTCLTVFCSSNENVHVAYYNGTNVRHFVLTYALVIKKGVTTIPSTHANPIVRITGVVTLVESAVVENFELYFEESDATTYNHKVYQTISVLTGITLGATSTTVFLRSVGLATKAFYYGNTVYVVTAYESPLQSTYFVAKSDKQVVGKISSTIGAGLNAGPTLSEVVSVSATEWFTALGQKQELQSIGGTVFSNEGLIEANILFLTNNTYLRAQLANGLYFTGGFLGMYDGVSVVESGYHVYPEQGSTTTAGGGTINAGTYQYCFVYEWKDNQGQIHYSAPSVPQTLVLGGSVGQINFVAPTLRLTSKQAAYGRSEVTIAVYRTDANGSVFYKSATGTNNTGADTVTIVDMTSNAVITGNQLLYTTGEVLENIAPPAIALICNFKNRIMYVPSEDRFSFGFSKNHLPGNPVEFAAEFKKPVNAFGGEITAIAQMDDKFIIFKRNDIFYSAGDGPNDTGTQDDFVIPQIITTDAGCVNPRSLAVLPIGLIFQSGKGIYLLDRSMQTQYIGMDVERYNDLNITAAILVPNTNQVRFTTEEGICLVYDYLFQQWSTFTNHTAVDATVFQNLFTFLTPQGTPRQETIGAFLDGAEFIKVKLRTSWLSFGGLQGFQRVYQMLLLGEYKSLHRLILRAGHNFNENASQEQYINAGELLQTDKYGEDATYGASSPYGGAYPLYQFRWFLKTQKSQTVFIEIEEVQDSNYGEGLSLSAMAFRVGVKAGLNRMPASRSF